MLCALGGAACFVGMDSCVKLLAGRLPVLQTTFLIALIAPVPSLLWTLRHGGLARLATRRPVLQAGRGLLMLLGTLGFFLAVSHMPLADAYALIFTMPLMITALSVPLLGERVDLPRWAAILVGLAGVLIMLRPGGGLLGPYAFAALGGALCYALVNLLVRRAGTSETAEAFVVWGNLTMAGGAALLQPWLWTTPAASDLPILLLGGILGGLAFLLVALAFQKAPAAVAAPFQYTQMIWGVLLGLLLFGDRPDPVVLLGGAVVIAAGLFVLHRETRRA
jgi:drug/metabolite transporter (DMT)-like permease